MNRISFIHMHIFHLAQLCRADALCVRKIHNVHPIRCEILLCLRPARISLPVVPDEYGIVMKTFIILDLIEGVNDLTGVFSLPRG